MRYIFFILILVSCSDQKTYRVRINSMDPETKITSEKIVEFNAPSDSSAFKAGCSNYWSQKASVLEINKTFEGSPGYPVMPIPFYFSVESKNGSPVTFSKEEAERLTFATVNYYQTRVIPFIDTIIPIAKKPKSEPAKIY